MELINKIVIEQSTEKVWEIIADDFTNISKWASAIAYSSDNPNLKTKLDDAPTGGRVCSAPLFGEVRETLTHFDNQKKYFRYEASAEKLPTYIKTIANNFSLEALGHNRTELTTRVELELKPFPGYLLAPLMRLQMNRMAAQVLDELKHYAETGELHPHKLKSLKKLNKQAAKVSAT